VLASGLKPCSGLRLWVVYQDGDRTQTEQSRGAAAAAAAAAQSVHNEPPSNTESVVEVTHMAAWLPPIVPAGRRVVRDWG